ncbi:M28 family peptidase [Acidovorax sp.]|uniref:M28 family peptidase n=1 Tax=Acidovorax sp. TaxID=1872122 RepID=UPI00260AF625|nr:M28 family peptidase [Acidovorax sp.]
MQIPPIALRLGQSLLRITGALAAVALLLLAAMLVVTTMPGHSHRGALPAATAEQQALAQQLRQHVTVIAAQEHNARHPAALEAAAVYLESELVSYGYQVRREEFQASGVAVRNLEVAVPSHSTPGRRTIVVGAHYDSAHETPGANDNATGTAAVLALAKRLKNLGATAQADVMFVLYTNEEPPYFKTPLMGSQVHAKVLKDRGVSVAAMLSLETMGYFSDADGSQKYPWPLNQFYPTQGDFIAFVATTADLGLVRTAVGSFRSHAAFPSEGIAAPRFIPGVDYSDHAAYIDQGYPALMVTDTAPYRYPHYHTRQDTPDKVDFDRLARVVLGIEGVVRDLALQQ